MHCKVPGSITRELHLIRSANDISGLEKKTEFKIKEHELQIAIARPVVKLIPSTLSENPWTFTLGALSEGNPL